MLYFILFPALIGVTMEDLKSKKIYDGVTLINMLLALNFHLFFGDIKLCVIGLTAGILSVAFINLTRLQNLGGGDAKLMGMIGSFVGWKAAVLTIVIAFIIDKLWKRHFKRESCYPYSPYITAGFILVTLCQKLILY